jgi:hypothetical protein
MAAFRILSLDGGGILGTFGASFLAELEKQLGGEPIGRYFDLIAGTSTGGIIAGALALGEPAQRVRDFYRSDGAGIFERRRPQRPPVWKRPFVALGLAATNIALDKFGLDTDYLVGTKYGSKALEHALASFFAERTIGMAKTRLLIPAVDLTRGDTVMFKTPHLPGRVSRDPVLLMREVIRATTAAPTFFSAPSIREGSRYCDGGIWANNPGVAAFVEAMKIREDCKRECDTCFDVGEIHMLSIGCGHIGASLAPPDDQAGVGYWAAGRITEWMMRTQALGAEHQLHYLLGDRVHRVNFLLPDKETWAMDSARRVRELLHIGQERAHAELAKLRGVFFANVAEPFVPFTN